jgi:hypothetical protein
MLPRHMLSCWVPNKRPDGRPRFTYVEIVNKTLKSFGFDKDKLYGITWHDLNVKKASGSLSCVLLTSTLASPTQSLHLLSRVQIDPLY